MTCVNSVSVSPKTLTLKVGNWYYSASAEVCPTDATCKELTWHSANPAVATVNAANGYIYAKAAGTAKIYATATDGSGCTDYLTVTVTNAAIKVTSISLSDTSLTLEKGDSHTLSATVYPTNATNKTLHWYSDNPTVAPVCDGVVCALAKGTATITASATDGSGKSASCTVSVTEDVLVTSVNIKSSTKRIQIGNSFFLETTVTPANATNCKLLWTSNNPEVATVNPDSGLVCTKTLGTARITATAQDGSGKYDHCNVTVVPVPVTSVEIPETLHMYKGTMDMLTATVLPENATNKEVEWFSSNESIVYVERDNGALIAFENGQATIYAVSLYDNWIQDCCTVTVESIPVQSVSISPKQKTIAPNETATLTAAVTPTDATETAVTWSSNNPLVATVDANTGVVTAHRNGTAIITATTVSDNKTDTCTVTVDSREKVIVEKDPNNSSYSRIIFGDGKVWNCINHDIINDYNLDPNEPFSQRFYENTYQTKVIHPTTNKVSYQEPMKEYTDEEIKLIYTIDPLGLAAYVDEYASKLPDPNDGIQAYLEKILNFKDDIFYLLFNRYPKYYARDLLGNWYETSNKSDLTNVLSESEFLFDGHVIYDGATLLQFITVVLDVVSIAIQCPALKIADTIVDGITECIKYYSLCRSVATSVLNGDFNGFLAAILNGMVGEDALDGDFITPSNYKTKNYTLGWAFELLSFSSDLEALADTFKRGPHFYKEIFARCDNDLNYCIMIRTTDNELISISDINRVIE